MLYLLDRDVRTVRWNGLPLHEASSAIVKEELNGDHFLVVKYPISDSGIYRQIREDMLIKAPVPVLGPQLFRIKKPVEHDEYVELTAYHITEDIMKRSVEPLGVNQTGCAMALSQLVQMVKTPLGDFSLTSDIFDRHTFNTKETETLYSVLMDGKHSIVGTWEGELVRDNFALSVKKARGADRGVIITTHNNLESYQRTRNSQGVVTRIHAKATFRPEGAEVDTVLQVTVDSPLINQYPYINEKEYENNEAKTVEDLRKWAEAKFKHEKIDQTSDAIEITAVEMDGQTVHLGDTVTIKSGKHGVDLTKKAIAYEFDCLANGGKGAYLYLTFDDKPGAGGSGVSSGVSAAAEAILEAAQTAEDRAIDKAIANANAAFDAEFDKAKQAIEDGIEEAKAAAEVVKAEIGAEVEAVAREGQAVKQAVEAGLAEADRKVKAFESDVRSRVGQIETKANQVADQARQSDQKADQALTKAGTSETLAQTAKDTADRAIRQAGDNLRTAQERANQLQADLDTAKRSITSQARDILAQAQAQSELTRKVQTVEETANGTKSTVTELTKTVNANTGNLTSVTQRVATAENTLTNVRNQYSTLKTAVDDQTGKVTSLEQQTADLSSGLDGVKERFENLQIGTQNLVPNSKINESSNLYGFANRQVNLEAGKTYWFGARAKKTGGTAEKLTRVYMASSNWSERIWLDFAKTEYEAKWAKYTPKTSGVFGILSYWFPGDGDRSGTADVDWYMVAESDLEPTTWSAAEEDFRQELATYIRTATENSSRLEQSIQTTDGKAESAKTLAQQTARVLELKAEKSTLDSVTGRVSSAEGTIRLQAEQIAQRLTSTQVDSLVSGKGYQTKAQVDANITGRGYITNAALAGYVPTTTFDNYKTETAQAIERGLTATRALIPTEVGGRNLVRGSAELKQGSRGWAEGHWRTSGSGGSVEYNVTLPSSPIKGVTKGVRISSTDSNQIGLCQDGQSLPPGTYTFSVWVLGSSGLSPHISGAYSQESGKPFSAGSKYANLTDSNWTLVTQTFTLTKRYANISLAYLMLANPGTVYYAAPYIHASSLVGAWSPAPEDLVTSVDFNRVRETAELYERVIGRSEGDIQTNVARQVLTSQLYQTEVTQQQTDSELLSRMADGVPLIANSGFATDLSSYDIYDNGRTGHVTISRVADNLSKTGYAMAVRTAGSGTSPEFGGFRCTVYSAKNKEFLVRIVARIPIGRQIYFRNNPLGIGASWRWLSSVNGTGNYATYVAYVKSGYEGNFSNFGFWSIGGGTMPTASAPLIWHVSEYQIYDISSSKSDAVSTRVTQLADSYGIKILGNKEKILSELNLNSNGVRIAGKLIHLDGTVTASDAFFRSVLADKIEAGNIKAGAVTTAKIATGAVTADHLLVNQAMIDKLVTNSVWAERLFAQSAFMAKLQATKILVGQIDAGLINTAMLAANAVTADKLLVNQAFFNKLMANEAYLRQLFAKQAFITQVQSVELSANRIKSGILQAINGAMSVNLDSGQILYYTDQAALKRILSGYPTQFIKFATGNVDGKGPAGVTVIGSNRDGSESSNNGGFVGIRAWNGPNVDSLDLVGDEIRLASSAYDSSDGWDVTTLPGRLVIEPHRAVDRTTARIGLGDIRIFYNSTTYSSLVNILDRIFDNFKNLNNNGNYQRNFYDTWK